MFDLKQSTDAELAAALEQYYPLYQQLQLIVQVFEKESSSAAITSLEVEGDSVSVTYSSWYTCEYATIDASLRFPIGLLRLNREQLESEYKRLQEEEAARKKAENEAAKRAARYAQYQELKKEFELDKP